MIKMADLDKQYAENTPEVAKYVFEFWSSADNAGAGLLVFIFLIVILLFILSMFALVKKFTQKGFR